MRFEGCVDLVDEQAVQGWAWCPAEPSLRPTVALIDQEFKILARVVADLSRPDVAATGRHDGCYGFRVNLAVIDDARSEIGVMVVVEPTWQTLHAEPLRVALPPKKTLGNLDVLDDDRLLGWCRPADETLPAAVTILADDRETFEAAIGQYRQDLEKAGFGHGKWGFACSVPPHLCDGLEHTFAALAPDGTPLGPTLRGRTSALRHSPYAGRVVTAFQAHDPQQGWRVRITGFARRPDAPDLPVSVAVQAGDSLLVVAFTDPEADGAFDVPIPRDVLLAQGFETPVRVHVHGERFPLPGLERSVGELLQHS